MLGARAAHNTLESIPTSRPLRFASHLGGKRGKGGRGWKREGRGGGVKRGILRVENV